VTAAHLVAMVARPDSQLVADIGERTLTHGTNYSVTAITIAAGTVVTLDGQNQANPVFLFQAGTALATGVGT
jgi:hypothetical protein